MRIFFSPWRNPVQPRSGEINEQLVACCRVVWTDSFSRRCARGDAVAFKTSRL